MSSEYPSAPPPPYTSTNEPYQQQPPYNSQPYSNQPSSAPPYPPQSYPSDPYNAQPYSQQPPQQPPPSEPFGTQPYHYGNIDEGSDFDTAGAFTERSIRAGTVHTQITH